MRLVLVIGNSIRQWFLSQSAYINPIKLSVGKAVRVCVCVPFVCMVHIKFRFDDIESWAGGAAAISLLLRLLLSATVFSGNSFSD